MEFLLREELSAMTEQRSHCLERRTVNIRQFAKEFGISAPVAYQLAHEDRLPVPVIKLGRRMVISRSALDELLDQRKV